MNDIDIFTAKIDEDIRGYVFAQAMEFSQFLGLRQNGDMKSRFFDQVLDIMTKLQALKYHLSNYESKEKKHITHIRSVFESNTKSTESAYDLLFELEAFLFQIKSTLDITVKILGVLLPKRFKVQTFGDKGQALIKGLNGYLNDNDAREKTVNSLIKMLQEDKDSWMEQTIDLRDKVSHYKTFSKYKYSVKQIDGKLEVYEPIVAGFGVHNYMKMAYSNCIEFVRDFMCLSIEMILPPVFQLGIAKNPRVGDPLGKYVKYSLYFSEKANFISDDKGK